MHYTEPLPMDQAELREAARKLAAIDEAGYLARFDEVLHERIDEHREAINRHAWHAQRPGTWFPIVGLLERYLDVPREQAEAAALELCQPSKRSLTLELIDEAYAKITTRQRRAS